MSHRIIRSLAAAAAALTLLGPAQAAAQVAGARIPVGMNPLGIAVNPVTNKVYVANADSDTVTVIDAAGATTTIPVGDYPAWVAVNPETNTVYVSTLTGANTAVIDGSTDTVTTTLASGGGGWTALNPLIDTAYVLRYGGGDEVNVIEGELYELTSATRSFQPVALAVNPVNNWLYIVHAGTGDITALDMTTPMPYPPLKCPDGSGGFRPQPPEPPPTPPDPYSLPCIDVPNTPVAVAINPVTNRIYGLSDAASEQISVISGANHTYTSLTAPGTPGAAKAIAVNPVTNRIYAAFRDAVVIVNGADNTMTSIPTGSVGGGPAAIGINVLTNMVYVPNADGTMLVIDGATGASSTIAIPAGANGIAVNPVTNTVFVLDSAGGVTPVSGAEGTATATGITTTITPLAGNSGGTSGSITLNASSAFSPAPLDIVRRVYYRIGTTGPWSLATGAGPYTASWSGLAQGPYTLYAFATNSLEAPSINTDLASVPIVGNIASYEFFVADPNAPPPAELSLSQAASADPVGVGKDVMFVLTANNNGPGTATSVTVTSTLPPGSTYVWSSAACTPAAGTVTCTASSLSSGATATFKVVVRPGSVGTATNNATVSAAEADPTPSNNDSAKTVTVLATPAAQLVQRYRLYSPVTQEHHFTTDVNEYNTLGTYAGTWVQEGPSGKVLDNPGQFNGVTAVPYYRLYDTSTQWHHWTTDANEYYTLIEFPWWNAEGVDGYILPTATTGATQLYRLLYPFINGLHHWTIDANEYNTLIADYGWVGEGGSGFVIE